MIFLLMIAGLLVLVAGILWVPFMPKRVESSDSREQQNIAIAREQKMQLEKQLQQGLLKPSEYDSALDDLHRSLALDLDTKEAGIKRRTGSRALLLTLCLIPVCSIALYLLLGTYPVVENPQLAQAPTQDMTLPEILERVKQRLRKNPEDAQGWFILGRTLMSMQQVDSAVTAFQRTYDLVGEEPEVMFILADALALQNQGSMAGEPSELVARGLELAPGAPTGLWLAGLAAEQRQDYQAAHAHWSAMLPQIVEDAASRAEIMRLIQVLETRDPSLQSKPAVVASAGINLRVDLAASLRDKTTPQDTVFVYAKAEQGPAAPLAVKRLSVGDLPARVHLSDHDAMLPNLKLSLFTEVTLGARVSKSGDPEARPGDFYVEAKATNGQNSSEVLELMIDQVKVAQ